MLFSLAAKRKRILTHFKPFRAAKALHGEMPRARRKIDELPVVTEMQPFVDRI